jgi:hypothetical protein
MGGFMAVSSRRIVAQASFGVWGVRSLLHVAFHTLSAGFDDHLCARRTFGVCLYDTVMFVAFALWCTVCRPGECSVLGLLLSAVGRHSLGRTHYNQVCSCQGRVSGPADPCCGLLVYIS